MFCLLFSTFLSLPQSRTFSLIPACLSVSCPPLSLSVPLSSCGQCTLLAAWFLPTVCLLMVKWGRPALLGLCVMRKTSLMFFLRQRTPITSPINLGATQRPPLSCCSSAVNKAAWRLLWSTSKRNRASFFHPSLPADCLAYLITVIIHSIRLPRGGPYSSMHSVCCKEQKQPDILTAFICTCMPCNGSLDISC